MLAASGGCARAPVYRAGLRSDLDAGSIAVLEGMVGGMLAGLAREGHECNGVIE